MSFEQENNIAIIILNYGRADDTCECLTSILDSDQLQATVFVLDNGSDALEREKLRDFSAKLEHVRFMESKVNLGFAGGANFVLNEVLKEPSYSHVFFLNNDTTISKETLPRALVTIDRAAKKELVGVRMMSYFEPEQVDNLGIAMFGSCIASSRQKLQYTFFGPSGGAMLVTTDFARVVLEKTGEFFDDEFFAYAEDTDLCFRALHLGYTPVYVDDAVVLHKGSMTSGGKFNEFVMYQGLRNSLWMNIKNIPAGIFWRKFHWILLVHVSVILKYTIKGKFSLTYRIYKDAFAKRRIMQEKRARLFAQRVRSNRELLEFMEPSFYEGDYIKNTLRSLFKRDIASSPLLQDRLVEERKSLK